MSLRILLLYILGFYLLAILFDAQVIFAYVVRDIMEISLLVLLLENFCL